MPAPQIDGARKLAPIEGTPLNYVVNSATPIIEVDPQSWYACQNGVWYVATSANGPWTVAASVPAVIYTIPTSSPLHYLTYVQVYGATPDVVYEGYTPGYMGTEVAHDGTVVYGTGYDYRPGSARSGTGRHVPGAGVLTMCWTPWWGWGFDCGFGWGCGFGRIRHLGLRPAVPMLGRIWAASTITTGTDGEGMTGAAKDGETGAVEVGATPAAISITGAARVFAPGNFGRAYNSRTGNLAAGQSGRMQSVSGSAWNHGGALAGPGPP